MAIANLTRMTDDTLAARMVAAKRALNDAQATYDALAAEAVKREWPETIHTDGGIVTYSPASKRVGLDGEKAKSLIPNWRETCVKETNVKASVRVTFR